LKLRDAIGDLAIFAIVLAGLLGTAANAVQAQPGNRRTALRTAAPPSATYRIEVLRLDPPRLAVTADLPVAGRELAMDTERPAEIPELDAGGWPAFVSNLWVSDATGRPLEVASAGEAGWRLAQPHSGRVTLHYEVDYAALAARGWPALREAAFADANDLVFIGRSLFVTTPGMGASTIAFTLPRGWRAVTPWAPRPGSHAAYSVRTPVELLRNLVVLTRSVPDVVSAGGFRLLVVPMGQWQPAREEVGRVLRAAIPRLVRLIGFEERENYLVVLLPVAERGGESFQQSFALTVGDPPSRANRAAWGNTLAHEIFHYWNAGRLHGADYPSSQWFQEGFTEYAANLSLVTGKLVTPDEFLRKLAEHVGNARRLTTSLEGSGSHKGPPLYSAGALVAFTWDLSIRQATGGRRSLKDFWRALWRQTAGGRRPFEWRDLQSALEATALEDWEAFHRAYIAGSEPLPLDRTLALAGLRLASPEGEPPRIEVDPAAPAAAKALWRALVAGR
jgi:predicted metalloprotease with PDZ domain